MSILYSENQSKIIVRDIDIAKSFGYFLCFLFVPVALFIFMGFTNFQLNLFLLKGFFIHDAAFKFVSTVYPASWIINGACVLAVLAFSAIYGFWSIAKIRRRNMELRELKRRFGEQETGLSEIAPPIDTDHDGTYSVKGNTFKNRKSAEAYLELAERRQTLYRPVSLTDMGLAVGRFILNHLGFVIALSVIVFCFVMVLRLEKGEAVSAPAIVDHFEKSAFGPSPYGYRIDRVFKWDKPITVYVEFEDYLNLSDKIERTLSRISSEIGLPVLTTSQRERSTDVVIEFVNTVVANPEGVAMVIRPEDHVDHGRFKSMRILVSLNALRHRFDSHGNTSQNDFESAVLDLPNSIALHVLGLGGENRNLHRNFHDRSDGKIRLTTLLAAVYYDRRLTPEMPKGRLEEFPIFPRSVRIRVI